jgi:hypothetical protein
VVRRCPRDRRPLRLSRQSGRFLSFVASSFHIPPCVWTGRLRNCFGLDRRSSGVVPGAGGTGRGGPRVCRDSCTVPRTCTVFALLRCLALGVWGPRAADPRAQHAGARIYSLIHRTDSSLLFLLSIHSVPNPARCETYQLTMPRHWLAPRAIPIPSARLPHMRETHTAAPSVVHTAHPTLRSNVSVHAAEIVVTSDLVTACPLIVSYPSLSE